MNSYKVLDKQFFSFGNYSIVPIRMDDRYDIMRWRNEQMYHLRQTKPLTKEEQDRYFDEVVSKLFDQEKPDQILFSYLEGEKCIGYGGLVHINWIDRNAEISFLIDTQITHELFVHHWREFLQMIEEVAFGQLNLHKVYTYAFDVRQELYVALDKSGYAKEAVLLEHAVVHNRYVDAIIHSKISGKTYLRDAGFFDLDQTYKWVNDPVVRKYSFTKDKIAFDHHKQWFLDKLSSNNCNYYVLISDNVHAGSIRFDKKDDGRFLISFLIDPIFCGQGLGKEIIKQGVKRLISQRNDVNAVYGLVQSENIASIKIFENQGFAKTVHTPGTFRYEKTL